jgi:hypothetical protein
MSEDKIWQKSPDGDAYGTVMQIVIPRLQMFEARDSVDIRDIIVGRHLAHMARVLDASIRDFAPGTPTPAMITEETPVTGAEAKTTAEVDVEAEYQAAVKAAEEI